MGLSTNAGEEGCVSNILGKFGVEDDILLNEPVLIGDLEAPTLTIDPDLLMDCPKPAGLVRFIELLASRKACLTRRGITGATDLPSGVTILLLFMLLPNVGEPAVPVLLNKTVSPDALGFIAPKVRLGLRAARGELVSLLEPDLEQGDSPSPAPFGEVG